MKRSHDHDDQAAETTARPLLPDAPEQGKEHPTNDESLRELEPRSIDRQFGESPDIEPEPDQKEGVREWYRNSPGMKESFPEEREEGEKSETGEK